MALHENQRVRMQHINGSNSSLPVVF